MSLLHLIVNNPDDPHGVPLFDGSDDEAARLSTLLVPGTYTAVWSTRYEDGTTFEHAGTIDVETGDDGVMQCWDERTATLGQCGCAANGYADKLHA